MKAVSIVRKALALPCSPDSLLSYFEAFMITDTRYTCKGLGWVRVNGVEREKCSGCTDCQGKPKAEQAWPRLILVTMCLQCGRVHRVQFADGAHFPSTKVERGYCSQCSGKLHFAHYEVSHHD